MYYARSVHSPAVRLGAYLAIIDLLHDLLFSAPIQLHAHVDNAQSTATVTSDYARRPGAGCLRHPASHGYTQAARAHRALVAGAFIEYA